MAVRKTLQTREGKVCGNECTVLNRQQVENIYLAPVSETVVIQRFVRAKGGRACLVRTKWHSSKAGVSYSISHTASYPLDSACPGSLTTLRKPGSSLVTRSQQGRHLRETQRVLGQVVQYLQLHLQVRVQSLVGDFIRDVEGVYWMLGVKAIQV